MSTQAPVIRVEHTGPILIGFGGHWFFFGLYILQIAHYTRKYLKTDQLFIKIIVYAICVGIFFQCWVITNIAWRQLVIGWGHPDIFAEVRFTEALPPITSGTISLAVQSFYAWRIYKFGRGNKVVTAGAIFISMMALAQCGAAISVTVVFNKLGRVPTLMYKLHLSMELWLSISLVCDILISFAMLALLMRARVRSPLKTTDRMINHLMILTVETGALTVAASLTQLAVYVAYPDYYIHLAVLYMLYSIYANVLLATLNGRDRARKYAMASLYTSDILSARVRVRIPVISGPSAIEYRNPDLNDSEGGMDSVARRMSKSCGETNTQDIFLTTGFSGSDDTSTKQ